MDISDCCCEPMEIDQSMTSVKSLDNSAEVQPNITISPKKRRVISPLKEEATATITDHLQSESAKGQVEWKIKKFHLKKETLANRNKFLHAKLIVALVVLCFAVIGYYATFTCCIDELQLGEIELALSTKLYGQKFAADEVIKTLKVETSSKILFFYGGTGVGKTYTSSLILKDSWNYSNIYHFTMPSFADTFTTNLLSGLILCKSAVIVVDNLTPHDMKVSAQVKEVVEKSENLGKNLTIFLIYNCDTVSTGFVRKCDTKFLEDLQENYREVNALKAFVKFETLVKEDLRKCIQDEIGHTTVAEALMVEFLKNFDVSSDGCKGVHSKIKFLNLL